MKTYVTVYGKSGLRNQIASFCGEDDIVVDFPYSRLDRSKIAEELVAGLLAGIQFVAKHGSPFEVK